MDKFWNLHFERQKVLIKKGQQILNLLIEWVGLGKGGGYDITCGGAKNLQKKMMGSEIF